MLRSRLLLALLSVAVLSASPLAARDVFVDNLNGNDRNIGTSDTNSSLGGGPCRTTRRRDGLTRSALHPAGAPISLSYSSRTIR